jgi:hypothetical protein
MVLKFEKLDNLCWQSHTGKRTVPPNVFDAYLVPQQGNFLPQTIRFHHQGLPDLCAQWLLKRQNASERVKGPISQSPTVGGNLKQ